MSVALTAEPNTLYKLPVTKQQLLCIIESMLKELDNVPQDLELLLVDDAAMETVHKETFGLCGPTNILSFPATLQENSLAEDRSSNLLGSLVLSVDTLLRECFLYQQPGVEHTIRLLAHGIAHLVGYDHGDAMDSLCLTLEKKANDAYNKI